MALRTEWCRRFGHTLHRGFRAEDYNLVAHLAVYSAHVDRTRVRADAAYGRGFPTVDGLERTAAETAVHPVGIADGNGRYRGRLVEHSAPSVAHRLTGLVTTYGNYHRAQTRNGCQRATASKRIMP